MTSKLSFKLSKSTKRELALMNPKFKSAYKTMMIDAEETAAAVKNRRVSELGSEKEPKDSAQ